jgi:hypothetical protein
MLAVIFVILIGFFMLNGFEDTICPSDQQGVVLICTFDQQLYSCLLIAALVSAARKICASIIAQTGWGSGI